jgi:hypothetical protein
MAIKPILFNTEMVRAILDGRKTCTRRLVKPQPDEKHTFPLGFVTDSTEKKEVGCFGFGIDEYGGSIQYAKPPYQPGDILYVRETWQCWRAHRYEATADIRFRAGGDDVRLQFANGNTDSINRLDYDTFVHKWFSHNGEWKPSLFMPKKAARIWLKVTDVRVERLQEIDEDGVWDEGFRFKPPCLTRVSADGHTCDLDGPCTSSIKYCDMTMGELFGRELWNNTIKKSDLDRYGWEANPWVWVISFERCEKPEGV